LPGWKAPTKASQSSHAFGQPQRQHHQQHANYDYPYIVVVRSGRHFLVLPGPAAFSDLTEGRPVIPPCLLVKLPLPVGSNAHLHRGHHSHAKRAANNRTNEASKHATHWNHLLSTYLLRLCPLRYSAGLTTL